MSDKPEHAQPQIADDDFVGRHYYVHGRVQGVWFRQSTKRTAKRLGVRGWARNLSNGQVEIKACGTREQMQAFEDWVRIGPEGADVTQLEVNTLARKDCNFWVFRVRRTASRD